MTPISGLDLFCGAGGASMGLSRAGFKMTGVDLHAQPHYPFTFIEADALHFPLDGFDFIWASPPCQAFTAYKRRKNHVKPREDLIASIRARLKKSKAPYVIENVAGAPLENAIRLCGSMFGLDVRRHRFFESSFPIGTLECRHETQTPRFTPASNRTNLRSTVEIGVWRIPLAIQKKAMGIDWMPLPSLSQAIPPAYSEYIANEWKELRKQDEKD